MNRILLLSLIVLGVGCSSDQPPYPTAAVTGKVILYGEPLKAGAISFIPEPGTTGATVGGEILGGAYAVKGVPKGTHRVFIAVASETAPTLNSAAPTKLVPPIPLPAKYEAGIVTEVKEDCQVDFDIQREKK